MLSVLLHFPTTVSCMVQTISTCGGKQRPQTFNLSETCSSWHCSSQPSWAKRKHHHQGHACCDPETTGPLANVAIIALLRSKEKTISALTNFCLNTCSFRNRLCRCCLFLSPIQTGEHIDAEEVPVRQHVTKQVFSRSTGDQNLPHERHH